MAEGDKAPSGGEGREEAPEALRFSPRVTAVPVVHGSGDFAQEVRDLILRHEPDCLAVPLPPSFQEEVEAGVEDLPLVSMAAAEEPGFGLEWRQGEEDAPEPYGEEDFPAGEDLSEDFGEEGGEFDAREEAAGRHPPLPAYNYVPIDPCQPVIAALRTAQGERIPRAFVDMELHRFQPEEGVYPDPYALKKVPLEAFAAALLTAAPRPPEGSQREVRIRWMAHRLRKLEEEYGRILFVCAALDWPWIRQAFREKLPVLDPDSLLDSPSFKEAFGPGFPPLERMEEEEKEGEEEKEREEMRGREEIPLPDSFARYLPPRRYTVSEETLAFILGEIPYITYLYEKRREELRGDRHLAIDGVKELLLEARAAWMKEHSPVSNWVTPQRLQIFLQYVRNLCLQGRRLTPDLFTLVLAAKQVAGDEFALTLAETARRYPYQTDPGLGGDPGVEAESPRGWEEEEEEGESGRVRVGVDRAEFPGGEVGQIKNRLGGQAVLWRRISLKPKPKPFQKKSWAQKWNPLGQCSWPPEDDRIESFHTHVREQAKALLGEDLARTEKFTTSIKDGLDIRETLRNWHTGDLYVKEIPPARGSLDVVIFLFDTPADPD
ncbi:MAG: hypothetical protein V3V62_08140, partial [bacterium]